ncbi:hypothetical protein HJ173_24950, partial [Vibrio parahaemolyticus]|nr:hypothetical protein [Vibrio parahaemolyticus]
IELDDDIRLNSPIDQTTKVRLFGEFEGRQAKTVLKHASVEQLERVLNVITEFKEGSPSLIPNLDRSALAFRD